MSASCFLNRFDTQGFGSSFKSLQNSINQSSSKKPRLMAGSKKVYDSAALVSVPLVTPFYVNLPDSKEDSLEKSKYFHKVDSRQNMETIEEEIIEMLGSGDFLLKEVPEDTAYVSMEDMVTFTYGALPCIVVCAIATTSAGDIMTVVAHTMDTITSNGKVSNEELRLAKRGESKGSQALELIQEYVNQWEGSIIHSLKSNLGKSETLNPTINYCLVGSTPSTRGILNAFQQAFNVLDCNVVTTESDDESDGYSVLVKGGTIYYGRDSVFTNKSGQVVFREVLGGESDYSEDESNL